MLRPAGNWNVMGYDLRVIRHELCIHTLIIRKKIRQQPKAKVSLRLKGEQ